MKPVLISSGEPAGIGPDICLALAEFGLPVVILADQLVLEERAKLLNLNVTIKIYKTGTALECVPGTLNILPVTCPYPVIPGQLNPRNSPYVIELLHKSASLCAAGEFSAIVTAPVHKANINEANIPFTGHTEFYADFFKIDDVVMLLACPEMKVALATTHLPLRDVPNAITQNLITKVVSQVNHSLIRDFGIRKPRIKIAGLNPHAGESGHLGTEELKEIKPALESLKEKGMLLDGPLPADTMFSKENNQVCDAYIAMYHDQGLAVLKYVGFNNAVNITLGLPIIRTSVDHGTALDIAGTGKANCESMLAAVKVATSMALNRTKKMSLISLIAAIDEDGGLGRDNKLLCHLPADLQHFKKLTLGKPIIMGRNTFESIGRILPGRANIVVSGTMKPMEGLTIVKTLEDAIESASDTASQKDAPAEIMVIGGAQLYESSIAKADRLYITRIHHRFAAHVFFPPIPTNEWRCDSKETRPKDEKNNYDMTFYTYNRI